VKECSKDVIVDIASALQHSMSIQLLRAGIVLKAMTIEARKGASFS
jgi:hypothetical protein